MQHGNSPQARLTKLADDLFWCLGERYVARDEMVLKNGNELVSFYVGLDETDAAKIASSIESVIGPVRRRRIGQLLDQIEATVAELRAET